MEITNIQKFSGLVQSGEAKHRSSHRSVIKYFETINKLNEFGSNESIIKHYDTIEFMYNQQCNNNIIKLGSSRDDIIKSYMEEAKAIMMLRVRSLDDIDTFYRLYADIGNLLDEENNE